MKMPKKMNRKGPIIIIEDDVEDQEFLVEIFNELQIQNEIIYFTDGEKALNYLTNSFVEPFIIISDINMPILNGMALREKIQNNEQLRLKCIPYLFLTTTANQEHVIEAYSKSIQGFFTKPHKINDLRNMIKKIIDYWTVCVSPNYIK